MGGVNGKGKECGPKQRRGLAFCLPFVCLHLVTATSFATVTYEWNSQSSGVMKQMPHSCKHSSFSYRRGNGQRHQHVLCSSVSLYVHRHHTIPTCPVQFTVALRLQRPYDTNMSCAVQCGFTSTATIRYQHVLCSSVWLYVHRDHTIPTCPVQFSVALRPQRP